MVIGDESVFYHMGLREIVINYRRHRPLIQVFLWLGLVLLETALVAGIADLQQALVRNLLNMAIIAGLVYFNLMVLVPRLLLPRNYFWYGLSLSLVVLLLMPVRAYVDAMFLEKTWIGIELFSVRHFAAILVSFGIFLMVTMSIRFVENWFRQQKVEQELKSAKLEAELRFLRMQVNPHFLFNTLNNIYSLVYANDPRGADLVLRLSGMMRYMVDSGEKPWVPLREEVHFLEDVIALEQIKTDGKRIVVFEKDIIETGIMVPPMIFLSFVENAFKHSPAPPEPGSKVVIHLVREEDWLRFRVRNGIARGTGPKDRQGGIGHANVAERLSLLFPKDHRLEITSDNGEYSVDLRIRIQALTQYAVEVSHSG